MVTINVGTNEPDEDRHVFSLLSDIGGELAQTHEYVSVSSHALDTDDDTSAEDELTFDENTHLKLREAIKESLAPYGLGGESDDVVTDVISCIQNAGIFFREKAK